MRYTFLGFLMIDRVLEVGVEARVGCNKQVFDVSLPVGAEEDEVGA